MKIRVRNVCKNLSFLIEGDTIENCKEYAIELIKENNWRRRDCSSVDINKPTSHGILDL